MRLILFFLVLGAMAIAFPANAQEESSILSVGETAPDFTIPGATRYGVLQDDVSLSDYRGNTVVLAFFFKARTGG
jgi:peroxiredoxin Q/BCP